MIPSLKGEGSHIELPPRMDAEGANPVLEECRKGK